MPVTVIGTPRANILTQCSAPGDGPVVPGPGGDPVTGAGLQVMVTPLVDGLATIKSTALCPVNGFAMSGACTVAGHLTVGDIPTISPAPSITRSCKSLPLDSTTPGNVWHAVGSGLPLTADDRVVQVLDVPHGSLLTSVTVWITGGTHSSLPSNMPTVSVQRVVLASASSTAIGSAGDTSANTTVYDARHGIVVPISPNETIDLVDNLYVIDFTAESGSNSNNNSVYVGATWTAGLANLGP